MNTEQKDLNVFANTLLQAYDLPDFFRLALLINILFSHKIEHIDIMPGGLTNKNFKATLANGRMIVMRVAGKGTAGYLNRPAEKHNASLMASIGIAPEVYYYDKETGSQLCEYIGAVTMHAEDFQTHHDALTKAAQVMKKYHQSGCEFMSRFDPMAKISTYLNIIEEHNSTAMYDEFTSVKSKLDLLYAAYQRNPPPLVPCHNDTLPENFLYDGKSMRMIDWEYGGMNDCYFDLGCFIVENPLDAETEALFIEAYFEASPTEEQLARILLNKFLVNAHWAIWSLVQICYGKDPNFYWDYGQYRITYCNNLIQDKNFDHYLALLG